MGTLRTTTPRVRGARENDECRGRPIRRNALQDKIWVHHGVRQLLQQRAILQEERRDGHASKVLPRAQRRQNVADQSRVRGLGIASSAAEGVLWIRFGLVQKIRRGVRVRRIAFRFVSHGYGVWGLEHKRCARDAGRASQHRFPATNERAHYVHATAFKRSEKRKSQAVRGRERQNTVDCGPPRCVATCESGCA